MCTCLICYGNFKEFSNTSTESECIKIYEDDLKRSFVRDVGRDVAPTSRAQKNTIKTIPLKSTITYSLDIYLMKGFIPAIASWSF